MTKQNNNKTKQKQINKQKPFKSGWNTYMLDVCMHACVSYKGCVRPDCVWM